MFKTKKKSTAAVAPGDGAAAAAAEQSAQPEQSLAAKNTRKSAVEQAKERLAQKETNPKNVVGNGRATVIFSDAADATTSGASGNSNEVLRALVEGQYPGRVLFPIVDPDAVAAAAEIGEGGQGTISLGGLDPRYPPLPLEVTVESFKTEVPLM